MEMFFQSGRPSFVLEDVVVEELESFVESPAPVELAPAEELGE